MQDITTSVKGSSASALAALIQKLNTPWKMRLYFFRLLPSCWFWGVRVKACSADRAVVDIPYNWRSQNPFRSTYFAALAGAAELSTGLMALIAVQGLGRMSMLITGLEMRYYRKARGHTTFTCEAGPAIREAVRRAIESGIGQEVRVHTTGSSADGEVVCEAWFTWSFKQKA
ncbi:MAG: DUF4442 domain-containing protein [Lewinellaceae bacterium]|nr:DUF4442 domain-containing protein [Lewinellaceae bacterium]